MALQFVSHKFSSLIFCEYLTTSAHKSSIVSFSSHFKINSAGSILLFHVCHRHSSDGKQKIIPIAVGDLEGELLQSAHTCASSATEVGSMEMPPTLFTFRSIFICCSRPLCVCLTSSAGSKWSSIPWLCTVWKCFAPNNRRCDLRNIFTRFCRPSTFQHMLPQETPLVPQEDLPAFHTEHLHVYIRLYFSNCWFFRCSCGLWWASLLYIYIYIFIYLFIFIYANGHSVL